PPATAVWDPPSAASENWGSRCRPARPAHVPIAQAPISRPPGADAALGEEWGGSDPAPRRDSGKVRYSRSAFSWEDLRTLPSVSEIPPPGRTRRQATSRI